jgi:hypothetical protein
MVNLLKRYRAQLGFVGVFLLGFAAAALMRPMPASAAFDLDDLIGKGIKVVGVKLIVDQFGGEINNFINQFLDNSNASVNAGSKVVAIISPIGGKHIGAAQITGPKAQVAKVGAVVQLETNVNIGTKLRLKALVPIEGSDPTDFKRVQGVGLSALIDMKL